MQQAISSTYGPPLRTDRPSRISRQARVGIIANTNEVVLPVHTPREIWVRWPKLRSARKREGRTSIPAEPSLDADPILSGAALHAFVCEIRVPGADATPAPDLSEPERAMGVDPPALGARPAPAFLPPGMAFRPYIRAGLLALGLAVGMIATSLLSF